MFKKIGNRIVAFCFVFLLLVPFLRAIDQEDKLVSKQEKRTLKTQPSLPTNTAQVTRYPDEMNDYYADHFGYREALTQQYLGIINRLGSHKNNFRLVTQGKGGWLFLGSAKAGETGTDDPIRDAINVNLYKPQELEAFAKSITKINEYLKSQGIHFTYMVAPNKHTIYFEKLPSYLKKMGSESALDQLFSYLQKYTDVHIVDVRQALFDAKDDYQLYFKQDTHWNSLGANVAQYELMKQLKETFPTSLSPKLLDISEFKKFDFRDGDLATSAQINPVQDNRYFPVFIWPCIAENMTTPEDKPKKRVVEVCTRKTLQALVYRDSFFEGLRPYISRQFRSSTYIWDHLTFKSLQEEIERRKPDVVIYEVVERTLPYIPSANIHNSDRPTNISTNISTIASPP